jgi:hypothetical protein
MNDDPRDAPTDWTAPARAEQGSTQAPSLPSAGVGRVAARNGAGRNGRRTHNWLVPLIIATEKKDDKRE